MTAPSRPGFAALSSTNSAIPLDVAPATDGLPTLPSRGCQILLVFSCATTKFSWNHDPAPQLDHVDDGDLRPGNRVGTAYALNSMGTLFAPGQRFECPLFQTLVKRLRLASESAFSAGTRRHGCRQDCRQLTSSPVPRHPGRDDSVSPRAGINPRALVRPTRQDGRSPRRAGFHPAMRDSGLSRNGPISSRRSSSSSARR
jgi:hypothetical protein